MTIMFFEYLLFNHMSGPGITKSSLLESISFQYLKVDINLKYYHAIVVAKNLIIST